MWITLTHICCNFVTSNEESRVAGWTSYSCGKEHVRRRWPNTPTGTSPDRSTPDQVYTYGCNLGSRPISVYAFLWRQQKTHDWLGEGAILAGKNKNVEEHNIIQSVTGKGHSNAWPGSASNNNNNKETNSMAFSPSWGNNSSSVDARIWMKLTLHDMVCYEILNSLLAQCQCGKFCTCHKAKI
jgi:hypothetical protein